MLPSRTRTDLVKYAVTIALACAATIGHAAGAQDSAAGPAEQQFGRLCQGCHGERGAGGDRAPALINNQDLRTMTEIQIHDVIKHGLAGGMPAFDLPQQQLQSLAAWLKSLNTSASSAQTAGDKAAGEHFFFGQGQCSTCHMVHGRGKSNGPDLSDIGLKRTLEKIEKVLDNPTSQMGMNSTSSCPFYAFCPDMSWAVVEVRLRRWLLAARFCP